MICENCNKKIDGTFGSSRFCNKSCASIFSNKNNPKRGKTYEEIYGKEKAKKIKEKLKNKIPHNKGQKGTLEELYGIEKAKKIKNKLKNRKTRLTWSKEKIIQKLKKITKEIGPIQRTDIKTLHYNFDFCTEVPIRSKWKNLDELAKEANIKFKNPIRLSRAGTNETKLLDEIEVSNNIKINRDIPVRVNNNQYYLDGYDPINKVAYEIDESHHKHQQVEDFIRERAIKDKLKCEFVRIKDGW